jgi:hypothetical protein
MDTLNMLDKVVQREVEAYAAAGWQTKDYIFSDIARQTYSVIAVPDPQRKDITHPMVVVMARIEGDYVVIEEDITDRPLVKELIRAGIPRERIILTYVGEQVPQPAP